VLPAWIRLPWWLRDPAQLEAMEADLPGSLGRRLFADELTDHPAVSASMAARRLGAARGYGAWAEGPNGVFRLVALLSPRSPDDVVVLCLDGPQGVDVASPHRNGHGSPLGLELCLYQPEDPPHLRRVPTDGLGALLDLARAHLLREFVWRAGGFWPGPEAPHSPSAGGG
jgi:hypothetical protein